MSYILEALKKADAERERERSAVPSLHAHTDALGFERELRGGAALGAKLAAGAVLLLAAGGAAWWWMQPTTAPSEGQPVASATPIALPAPEPAPVPVPAPAPPPIAPATPSPAPLAVVSATQPPAPVAQAPAPAPVPAPSPQPLRKASPPVTTAAPPATAARNDTERLPNRNQLPPELRAALPPLNVSGAVYAPASSGRMLFVNGLVLREGDAVADGLNVERIGRASSVLVFRGQRFELKH